ncbi:E1-like protein-activating [Mycena floridula]|nr:E1-like protein-activating [Mycena floridula]
MPLLQFTPLSSLVHPAFWHKLTEMKLDVLKLSDREVQLSAYYHPGRYIHDKTENKDVGLDGTFNVGEESFDLAASTGTPSTAAASTQDRAKVLPIVGTLKNYNTLEEFKAADKAALFKECAKGIWESMVDGKQAKEALEKSTDVLSTFLLITYADLKKYKYYYWFAFPAFGTRKGEKGWEYEEFEGVIGNKEDGFKEEELKAICEKVITSTPLYNFVLDRSDGKLSVLPLTSYKPGMTVAFIDPSTAPQNPGWPLRNILAWIKIMYPETTRVRVLCWRDIDASGTWRSRVGWVTTVPDSIPLSLDSLHSSPPPSVGWEKNPSLKLGPRLADLAPMMDPTILSTQALTLNLRLMRWRILPELNLESVSATKVLLLGAGTLGCYVARTLMAWGVQTITFVDNSRVSFSNPVRQPLFRFEDCLEGGREKAVCAAERLKEIWPGVNAKGVMMAIPMPGHPVPATDLEETEKIVAQLDQLIQEHDVVYLLMDSRESRWLPTMLGRGRGKLVINAALGFDTFLVMRHGAKQRETTTKEGDMDLGCYYCNDIVAPADSLSDRTLDQMCTVTRPGLASIAASTAVELMVSVIQHPDGIWAAPPPVTGSAGEGSAPGPSGSEAPGSSILGLVPHQLRGYLAQFRNMQIVGRRFERCTGCGDTVWQTYLNEGFPMLIKAFEDPKYLERLTGLDKLFEEGEKAMREMEALDLEDGDSGEDF